MTHSNNIMYMIGLGEVRMNFTNCIARLQVVKKDRAMGPTAQYNLGVKSVLASHRMRMSETSFVLIPT